MFHSLLPVIFQSFFNISYFFILGGHRGCIILFLKALVLAVKIYLLVLFSVNLHNSALGGYICRYLKQSIQSLLLASLLTLCQESEIILLDVQLVALGCRSQYKGLDCLVGGIKLNTAYKSIDFSTTKYHFYQFSLRFWFPGDSACHISHVLFTGIPCSLAEPTK